MGALVHPAPLEIEAHGGQHLAAEGLLLRLGKVAQKGRPIRRRQVPQPLDQGHQRRLQLPEQSIHLGPGVSRLPPVHEPGQGVVLEAPAGRQGPSIGEGLLQLGPDQFIIALRPSPGPQLLRPEGMGRAGGIQVLRHPLERVEGPAGSGRHGPGDGVLRRVRLQGQQKLLHLLGGLKGVELPRQEAYLGAPIGGGACRQHHPHIPGQGLADVGQIIGFFHERPKARLIFLPHGCIFPRVHCNTAPTKRKGGFQRETNIYHL